MNIARQYSYAPRFRLILFVSSAGIAWIVIVSLVCHCSPGKPTLAFGLVPITLGLLLAVRRFAFDCTLLLDTYELVLPAGFLRLRVTRIPFETIEHVWRVVLLGTAVLSVRTAKGKFEIPSTMLPDRNSYLEIEHLLLAKVQRNAIRRKDRSEDK